MHIMRFLHVKLDVADMARSIRFYCDLLGLTQVVRYDRDDGVTIVQVAPEGRTSGIELWYEPKNAGFANRRLHVAFEVTALDRLLERLRTKAVRIDREPFTIGHERIAFIRDPDGYLIELNELRARPQSPCP